MNASDELGRVPYLVFFLRNFCPALVENAKNLV